MNTNQIIQGDALSVLKTFPDESINCVMTSPPYWGLRDYGTEGMIWDAKEGCEHDFEIKVTENKIKEYKGDWDRPSRKAFSEVGEDTKCLVCGNMFKGKLGQKYCSIKCLNTLSNEKRHNSIPQKQICSFCGAWKGQLGLEPTFELYIKHLCDIFDEVKKVLRKDGTCWVNIGDTYSGSSCGKGDKTQNNKRKPERYKKTYLGQHAGKTLLSNKSLCNIPARFSIEMQNRGWILRNVIIWHKPNCMPCSVKDRFTVDFEYLFFFVKNKNYWFETQYEPHKNPIDVNYRKELRKNKIYNCKEPYQNNIPYSVQPRDKEFIDYRNLPDIEILSKRLNEERNKLGFTIGDIELNLGSQAPHHWFNAESYPSAEDWNKLKFIGFKIPEFDKQMTEVFTKSSEKTTSEFGRNKRTVWTITTKPFKEAHFATYPETLCETPIKAGCPLNGIVLDPFFGAGTTGLVALKQNKQFVGIEMNEKYIKIAQERLKPFLEQKKLF